MTNTLPTDNIELEKAKARLLRAFDYLYTHDGFGRLDVEMKFLKKGQKEILIRCGREYRFVVDSINSIERSITQTEINK